MVTVCVTDACATRNTVSGWLRECGKNPVTSALFGRSSALSQGEFGSATGRFGVPQERERGPTRGCG